MFLIFVAVLTILYYCWGIKPYTYWKKKGVLSLKALPFLGNVAPNFTRRQSFAELLYDLYSAFPNERYMGFYQFLRPNLLIRDPELIKTITVKEFDTFPDHWAFSREDVDPLWAKNLFAITGKARWREMRTILTPSFTSSKLKIMFEMINNCAKQYSEFYLKQDKPVVVEFKDSFKRFTNDVITATALGVTCNSLENPSNDFYVMGNEAIDFSGLNGLRFFLSYFSPAFMKWLKIGIYNRTVSRFFRSIIRDTVRIRKENDTYRPDMIHQLLESRRNRLNDETKTKAEITDDDITAQALLFYFAGVDSVSSTLCFATYELAINRSIQTRLRTEIDGTLEMCNGTITYEVIIGMKYLDMVINEALRKWPSTIVTDRVSTDQYTIEPENSGEIPIHLDAQTNCWIPIFAIHRDPKYYPSPEKFDPERFSDENKGNINPFAYLPFGVGPRNCIGARFSLLVCKLAVVEIISKFEIITVPQTQIPLKLHTSNFPLLAENGFWMGLKPRNQ